MAESSEARLKQVHARALKRNDDAQSAVRDVREQCREDRRFCTIAGAQFEGDLQEQFENLPKLEFNKTHLGVLRIENEYRNNRVTVKFRPDGREQRDYADALQGLYRADEEYSNAGEAYDTAFGEASMGGMGAFRLRARYEDEQDDEDERQRICIEAIPDADTRVYWDLNATSYDKREAKWCIVLTGMTREAYEEEYDDNPSDWPKMDGAGYFEWCTPDLVYVGEYYEVEEKKVWVRTYKSLLGDEKKKLEEASKFTPDGVEIDFEEQVANLIATGYREVSRKRVTRRKVHKYQMSGGDILRDEGLIAGTEIPVIPVYGKRWFIDGVERCMGHVRLPKDAQRLKNMVMSQLGLQAARSPIEKPIFAAEQVAPYSQLWADDVVENYPYMLADPIKNADGTIAQTGPIGYTKPPTLSPAMGAVLQIIDQDINELQGNQQASEELPANTAENTIELVQNRRDMMSFIYFDNFSTKSMRRAGEVWLSMVSEVYADEGREMETVNERGDTGFVTLREKSYDPQTGESFTDNDFANAKMKVFIDAGPDYTTRRQTTVKALMGMMSVTQDPQDLAVLSAGALMLMDGEGLKDFQDYYRNKLVRMGVVKPTDEEAQQMQEEAANAQPDPQAELVKAAAAEQATQAQKNQADTADKIAAAELKKAQTAKTLAETESITHDGVIRAVETVHSMGATENDQALKREQAEHQMRQPAKTQ